LAKERENLLMFYLLSSENAMHYNIILLLFLPYSISNSLVSTHWPLSVINLIN